MNTWFLGSELSTCFGNFIVILGQKWPHMKFIHILSYLSRLTAVSGVAKESVVELTCTPP